MFTGVDGDTSTWPSVACSVAKSGAVVTVAVTVCLATDVVLDECPNAPNVDGGILPDLPKNVVMFQLSYQGGNQSGVSSSLPVPALVFVWIGIGLVAAGCYGCLFWRWWKNRRLQQRTRTNMAAGANASKYLHSL